MKTINLTFINSKNIFKQIQNCYRKLGTVDKSVHQMPRDFRCNVRVDSSMTTEMIPSLEGHYIGAEPDLVPVGKGFTLL